MKGGIIVTSRSASTRVRNQNQASMWGGFAIVIVSCVIAGFVLQAAAVGTGAIKGRIIDLKTKQAIGFANVVVVGTSKGAMSLDNGTFTITGVPVGKHRVKAMMMGFKSVERTVTVEVNKTTEVNFILEETIVATMQEIIVMGERKIVDVTCSDVRSSVADEQVRDMPSDGAVDAMALKTGIVRTGDELHARGGRSGEIQSSLGSSSKEAGRHTGGHARGSRTGNGSGSARRKCSAILHNDAGRPLQVPQHLRIQLEPSNTEAYDVIEENEFLAAIDNPFSTFSIDVDAASYSNVRRFVRSNIMPPIDAVRIEELINYFTYDYPKPRGNTPFSITTEVAECPWNRDNKLVHVGLQGRRVAVENLPPSNLVFLLDVSGSMQPPNKLPLLKQAFRLLTEQLREVDRVAIVVYASQAGVVLPSTPGSNKTKILEAVSGLYADGSTNGAGGIRLAYDIAQDNFLDGGNNRVILATDGDFNVGVSSDGELVRLIEKKRETGIFLTVLGFGECNLKDAKMEKLAGNGNGHYAYIDNIREANRVLVNEMGSSLYTIAKDVKIQIEFNPARVQSYRLIGYENRLLKKKDFDDDKKDAGELGAGHSVTALYEIVPASRETASQTGGSRYVMVSLAAEALKTRELFTVHLRYKQPDADESELITESVNDRDKPFWKASRDFRFAAAVAEFGMLLRGSNLKGDANYVHVLEIARATRGEDEEGHRAEFARLVDAVRLIQLSSGSTEGR